MAEARERGWLVGKMIVEIICGGNLTLGSVPKRMLKEIGEQKGGEE